MNDDLLTVAEAAKYLKVTQAAVYQWIKRGEFAVERAGVRIRIRRSALDNWLQREGAARD